jgi:trimethylamine:corrinoid methyltransferase-like protein
MPRIHEASLEIPDRVGVRLDLPEAVDLLKKAGAKVEQENLVHLSCRLVESALASVSTC